MSDLSRNGERRERETDRETQENAERETVQKIAQYVRHNLNDGSVIIACIEINAR